MQSPIDPVNPFIQYSRILHYSMNKKQRKSNFQLMFMRKHLFLFFLLALFGVKGWGQVSLLSPTGDGGFETGTTFAANGWTAVQPGNTQQWQVGTAAGVQGGTRAAYVGSINSNNGSNITSVQHFYRDIYIPTGADNVTLSFYYQQTISDAGDNFYVFTTNPNHKPVSGTVPSTAAGSGYQQQFKITKTYSDYTVQSKDITVLAGTTVRLVFTFQSDGTTPGGNPAVDNISLTYTLPPAPTINTTGGLSKTSDCVNTGSLVIKGNNFTDVTSVKIGGTEVSNFTINSASQITASVMGGTTGKVSVTNLGGTATSAQTFTVNPLPGTVGTITGSAAVCPGSTVNYNIPTATNTTSYTWTVPTGWTITSGQGTTSMTATAGSAGQNGAVTVMANNACGSIGDVNQIININPLSGTNNTGYTTNTAKTSGNITVASSAADDNAGVRNGFLKFPLTGIPASATIISSTLSLNNITPDYASSLYNTVTGAGNNDPTTAAVGTLNTAIQNGTVYSSDTWNNIGIIPLSLNYQATTDLQSRLTNPGYVTMGLVRGQGYAIFQFYGYGNGANTPTLAVTYSPSKSLAVTVNAPTVISTQPTTTQTVCQNTAASLSVAATGTGTLTYQWYKNTTNSNTGGTIVTGATATTYTPTMATAGNTYYYAVVNGTCGKDTSNTATIVVNAATAITAQPAITGQTVCQNVAATALSVTATGTGVTYQWYSNTTNSNSGGTAISGATAASYTPGTANAGTTYYYVVVSGSCAPASVTSSVSGAVVVNPLTTISAQPTVTQTVCQSTTVSLSVTATGTGTLTYQWFSNITNSTTGGIFISGATSATFTPSTTAAGTIYYYVIVTGSCSTATSTTAAVVVNQTTTISTNPAGATYCQNGTATALTVNATGTGTLTYQWYKNATNSTSGGSPVSASATYTPVTTITGTTYYYVTVTGTCGTATSATAAVVVNPTTAISTNPSGATYCQSVAASPLSVSATGTGTLSYQWFSNTTNSTTGGAAISGATSATYTPSTTIAGTTYYYVVVTGGCSTATSSTAAVVVNQTTTITADPAGATYCKGVAASSLTVSATGTGTLTYQWYKNATNSTSGGSPVAASATYTPVTTITGTTYYYVTVTGTCGAATSATAAIVVNPATVISAQPLTTQTICQNGAATALTVTATGTGTFTYQWFSNTTNSTTGGKAIGTNSSSFTPSTIIAGTTYYYVVVTGTCSTATSTTAAVNVNQTTTISTDPAGATYCKGVTASSLTVSATGTGTLTYQWYKNATNSTTGGTPVAASATYTPVTTITGTTYYYVTVTGTCGAATSATAAVVVNPAPTITGQPVGATYCQNVAASALSVSGTDITSYQWYSNTTNSNSGGTLVGSSATFTPLTTAGSTTYYYVVVAGSCGTVTSTTAAVVVNPAPTITGDPVGATYCQNVASSPLSVSGANITSYRWFKNATNSNSGGTQVAASATYAPVTTTAGTSYYYVTVTGNCGSATSATAAVVINPAPAITRQPIVTQTNCQSIAATALSVTATGTNLTYQWFNNGITNSNNGGSPIGGATSSSYTPSTTTAGTTYYYAVVSNSSCAVATSTAAVIVNPTTTISTNPSGATYCQNSTAVNLSVTASGTGITYQWYSNTVNNNTTGTAISGATAATYTPATTATGTTYYYVVVTGTCNTVTSNLATIVVNATTTISAQPLATQTVCQNTALTALSVTAAGTSISYQWFSNTTNDNTTGTAISGATSAAYTPLTTTAGTTYYYVVVTGNCGTVPSNTASVVVNAATAIAGQLSTTGQTICQNGSATVLSVTATGTGLSYQWYSNTTNSNNSGTSISGATAASYAPGTANAGTTYYYVVVTGSCAPTSVTSGVSGVITVNAATGITSQPSTTVQTVCQGTAATQLSVTATGTNLQYQWYSNTTPTNSGGTAVTGITTTPTFTPPTITPGTLYYYVVVTGAWTLQAS